MLIQNIMADYDEAITRRGDGQYFPTGRHVFESIARRSIERKRRVGEILGVDDHGRASLVIQSDPKSAVNGLCDDSVVLQHWRNLGFVLRQWAIHEPGDDKNVARLLDWLQFVDHFHNTRAALANAFADENQKPIDTPMIDDASGRRVRLGKFLSKLKVPDSVWNEPLNGSQGIIAQVRAAAKSKLIFTVNPLDMYFQSSYQHGYTTCHSPTGLRKGGPWQYMADRISACVISVKPDLKDSDIFPFEKDGRVMLYIPDDNHVVVGRGYGRFQANHELAKHVTGFVTERMGGDHTEVGKWIAKNNLHLPHYKQNRTSAYPDSEIIRASVRGVPKEEGVVERTLPYLTFEAPFCSECGTEYDREEHDYKRACLDCDPEYDAKCERCSTGLFTEDDDTRCHDGDYYCESCYDTTFSHCDHCHDTVYGEDARSVTSRRGWEETWCDSCAGDHAFHCSLCDEYHDDSRANAVEMAHSYDGGRTVKYETESVCDSCVSEAVECDACGALMYDHSSRVELLVPVTGTSEHVCHSCVSERRADGTVVEYQQRYFTPDAMVQFRIDEYVNAVLADEFEFAKKGVMA